MNKQDIRDMDLRGHQASKKMGKRERETYEQYVNEKERVNPLVDIKE